MKDEWHFLAAKSFLVWLAKHRIKLMFVFFIWLIWCVHSNHCREETRLWEKIHKIQYEHIMNKKTR